MRKVNSNDSSNHSSQYIINTMNSTSWDSTTTTGKTTPPLTKERMLVSPKSTLSLSSTSATTTRKPKSRLLSLAKRKIYLKSSSTLSITSSTEHDLPSNSTVLVNKHIDEGLMISNHSTILSRIEQGQPIKR